MTNRQLRGGARNIGHNLIPQHLKKNKVKGLAEHPDMKKFIGKEPPDSPCGIMAFLLAVKTDLYRKKFDTWLEDSKKYGELIGLTSKFMTNGDFEKLLALDEFSDYRVLIFQQTRNIEFPAKGKNWIWGEDHPRSTPDPKTIHIFRDSCGDGHYYWINSIVEFTMQNKKSGSLPCYYCIKRMSSNIFDDHQCKIAHTFQCQICKIYLISEESLRNHESRSTKMDTCECCDQARFNGFDCFIRHHETNCNPPKNKTRVGCELCSRPYLIDREHICTDFGFCKNCGEKFEDVGTRKKHRCFLKQKSNFWGPCPKDETFICHYAYDFETCKEEVENIDEVKKIKHEVMAWAVQLVNIPCSIYQGYIKENKFLEALVTKLDDGLLHQRIRNDIQFTFVEGSIRFWGKSLESFIIFCSTILVQNGGKKHHAWKPILWAHNGAKFDSKFILDYYLNNQGFDLAGATYDELYKEPKLDADGKTVKLTTPFDYRKREDKQKKRVAQVSMIGAKVLQLRAQGVTFQCSYAHFTAPLRSLPKMFGLNDSMVKKGEFPYPLLQRSNWGKVFPRFPSLEYYEVDHLPRDRRKEIIDWYNVQPLNDPWNFDKELWEYLFADVDVLCKVLEAYHTKAEEIHMKLWRDPKHSDYLDKMVSPLQSMTLPGWALSMYQTWFLPENQLVILKDSEAKLVKESLRGGRTDKRATFMSLDHPDDSIKYVDFTSLYPSVQDCSVHGTHFPVGVPTWIPASGKGPTSNDRLTEFMGNKTGFIRISCKPLKYVTHPTLHRVGTTGGDKGNKLLFELDPKVKEVYAWPEIEEAIRCGEIEVTEVHEGLLFDRGTDVFTDYVRLFYEMKDSAGRAGNKGLKQLAKNLLNSLWGKLGQRSYSEREWVMDKTRRDLLIQKFEDKEWEMQSCIVKDDFKAYFQYRKPHDYNNLGTTACHIAAFVSMWGRVTLHKKLLEPHGQRALYCDTDSAIIYLRHGTDDFDKLRQYMPEQEKLGGLTDEVSDIASKSGKGFNEAFINQVVLIAPKTYGLELKDRLVPSLHYTKTVQKGFEPSFINDHEINFKSFRELAFTNNNLHGFMKRKCPGEFDDVQVRKKCTSIRKMQLVSSMARNEIVPSQKDNVERIMKGGYNKGRIHQYDWRLNVPFSEISKLRPPRETFLTRRDRHFD